MPGLPEEGQMVPEDLKYSKEHEWLRLDGDTATIGITHHAQEEMGDLVFVELPAKGDSLANKEVFGTVESVKAVSELFAPIDGEVVAVNDALVDRPELVNQDPYGEGWMLRVRVASGGDELMSAAEYQGFLQEDGDD
jgi:glycine cleavage system H protein